jgi:hypothetical protein
MTTLFSSAGEPHRHMHHTRMIAAGLACFAVLMAGCASQPQQGIYVDEVIETVAFDSPYDWEQYRDPERGITLGVQDGGYFAEIGDQGGIMWGLNLNAHTDIALQVDAQPLSDYEDNAYGVMCRAAPTNNGDGYYFLISSDGYFTIRVRAVDQINDLIAWTQTSAVQQGRSINRIRAVCVEDYLALYVNGQFVAETRDDRYSTGNAGLVAAVPQGGTVRARFDNLTIWSARLMGLTAG